MLTGILVPAAVRHSLDKLLLVRCEPQMSVSVFCIWPCTLCLGKAAQTWLTSLHSTDLYKVKINVHDMLRVVKMLRGLI